MAFIPRRIVDHLAELGTFYPVISLTGPRQAGKTTLLKRLYPDYRYVSLEKFAVREAALRDPAAFLKEYDDKVIFDEAQRVPELFSALQVIIDEDRRPGRFILSGSQNFLMRRSITQSLAGRVGIARLLPLDNGELRDAGKLTNSYQQALFQGSYPGLVESGFAPRLFYDGYLATYIERDVSELISPANLDLFRLFLRVVATYAGQPLNMTKVAKSVGITLPTVRSWLAILEQSYLVFRLPPFFRNLGKRLTKTPKIYFYDTGLLCYLLGLETLPEVNNYNDLGALFENFIVADAHKAMYHQGFRPRLYYYRDASKLEVDLVADHGTSAKLWEIKASSNFNQRMVGPVQKVASFWDRPVSTYLVYTGEEQNLAGQTQKVNWRELRWER